VRDVERARSTVSEASRASSEAWEAAYLRFESPEQEVAKFVARLKRLGADRWQRDAAIVELCCGRGNGLRALHELGFRDLEGVDLSPTLAARYSGPARVIVGDCRELPIADASKDVVVVQGGLHHLLELPRDLERTLAEARRVLKSGGRFVAVEPWPTPFLGFVHAVSGSALARRLSSKLDAFAVMVEHERATYEQWLGAPDAILALLGRFFEPQVSTRRWGKLEFVGVARKSAA
jgi:SAM-dependent methyltransferase